MVRYYIAGPMSGLPDHNYPEFNNAAAAFRAAGFEVVNPAEAFGGCKTLPYETYIKQSIKDLLDCTHVYMLRDWECSKGASLEHHVARVTRKIVEYQD